MVLFKVTEPPVPVGEVALILPPTKIALVAPTLIAVLPLLPLPVACAERPPVVTELLTPPAETCIDPAAVLAPAPLVVMVPRAPRFMLPPEVDSDTLPPASAALDVLSEVLPTPVVWMMPVPPETVNVIFPLLEVAIVPLGNVMLPPEELVKLKLPPILLGEKATFVAVELVIATLPV